MPPLQNLYCYAIIIVGLLAGVCKPDSAFGQTFFGAAPEALGLAGRAALNPIEAHYLNPAAISFLTPHHAGITYKSFRPEEGNPENAFSAVVIENSPENFVAASLGYLQERRSTPACTTFDQDLSLDIGVRALPTVGIGVQVRRLTRSFSDGSKGFTKHNISAGVLIAPAPFLGLAFVAYDFSEHPDQKFTPKIAIGSHLVILNIMRLRADVTRQEIQNPDRKGTLNLGLEFDLTSGFLLRGGGVWDNLNQKNYATGGLSWEGPNLSVAYAYRADTEVASQYTHTLQAWLSF